MNKLGLFLILLTALMASCGGNQRNNKYAVNGIPYEDEETEAHGLLQADGSQLSLNTDSIDNDFSPGMAVNGYFFIPGEDNEKTLCRLSGDSYTMIEKARGYEEFGVMSNGLIPACKSDENIVILNEEGDVVFTLKKYENTEVTKCYSYRSGILRVELANDQIIYVDKKGEMLFGKSFGWGTDFEDDYAIVSEKEKSYDLINSKGETLLSFESEDTDDIIFSAEYGYVCGSDDDNRFTIYNFEGETVKVLPKKVESICSFEKEGFIFENDDEYGLMDYAGKELIRAKYDQLVKNGNYYLAIHPDNDEEVLIIDSDGNTVDTLDGEEIISLAEFGYDFPIIIKRSDDEVYLIDEKGKKIGDGPWNYNIDIDEIKETNEVNNRYFPYDELLSAVMKSCGNGTGFAEGRNLFFYKGLKYCRPQDIEFIKNAPNYSEFSNTNTAVQTILSGANYGIYFYTCFSEPITLKSENHLNENAILKSLEIDVTYSNIFSGTALYNQCVHKLKELGCKEIYEIKNNYILVSKDQNNILALIRQNTHSFIILIVPYMEGYIIYCKQVIGQATTGNTDP